MNKLFLIAALLVATNAKAQKIQFYTLESGCKMEIWKDRSGESPIPIQRTEKLGQYTEITEGSWNVEIKCTAPVSLMMQIVSDGKRKPLNDSKMAKEWNLSIIPLANEAYIFTPYAVTKCNCTTVSK